MTSRTAEIRGSVLTVMGRHEAVLLGGTCVLIGVRYDTSQVRGRSVSLIRVGYIGSALRPVRWVIGFFGKERGTLNLRGIRLRVRAVPRWIKIRDTIRVFAFINGVRWVAA